MSWEPYNFKGQKIFARVDEAGKLVVEQGRVEIKFQESSEARIYRAAKRNIQPIDNSATANETTAKKSSSTGRKSNRRAKSTSSKGSAGSSRQSSSAPDELIWQHPVGERVTYTQKPESFIQLPPPKKGEWEIYTDGACSKNPGPCGSGVVIRSENFYQEISHYIGIGTNNIAELYAILIALELIKEANVKGTIHTDSDLCIGLLTRNWKAKVNKDLVAKCKQMMNGLAVSFVKVKGHAGIPQNERADKMAVESVKRQK